AGATDASVAAVAEQRGASESGRSAKASEPEDSAYSRGRRDLAVQKPVEERTLPAVDCVDSGFADCVREPGEPADRAECGAAAADCAAALSGRDTTAADPRGADGERAALADWRRGRAVAGVWRG